VNDVGQWGIIYRLFAMPSKGPQGREETVSSRRGHWMEKLMIPPPDSFAGKTYLVLPGPAAPHNYFDLVPTVQRCVLNSDALADSYPGKGTGMAVVLVLDLFSTSSSSAVTVLSPGLSAIPWRRTLDGPGHRSKGGRPYSTWAGYLPADVGVLCALGDPCLSPHSRCFHWAPSSK
ncbi:hypothetical protein SK128_028424, partial [Halocaridina rubra]